MDKKILIIRLGSLGDVILSSAAVTNLKIRYPDSRITFLCKDKFRDAVELIDGVDDIVGIADGLSAIAYYKILLELDSKNFNVVLDLQGNLRSWLARKTITADETIVYPKRRFDRLLAVKRKIIPKVWPHTIDLYNDAVEQAGAKAHCVRPVMSVPEIEFSEDVQRFVSGNERFVIVAPGAAHPNKQWPIERFVETATMIYGEEKVGIVWAVTSEDADKRSPKADIAPDSFLQLTDCPIPSLARLISLASVLIANDSGVAHLSSAVGTPVVAIFGPTHPALGFAPKGLYDRVIEVDEPCRPCSLHGKKKCYRDERYCFERISSRTVFEEAQEILRGRYEQTPAAFIDRDGTIIVDKNFLSDPDQVEFVDGSVEAIGKLSENGFKVVVISNQSGVARGYFGTGSVEKVNRRLMEMLAAHDVFIDAIYYCPHHPKGSVNEFTARCECRKPSAGMAEDAAYQLGVDIRKSFVVGDKIDDVNLAKVMGAGAFLVRTGYGSEQQNRIGGNSFHGDIKIVDNLLMAAEEIISSGDDA